MTRSKQPHCSATRGPLAAGSQKTRHDRGVALIITLLLLTLMSALGLAMVISMSSDMLINGYYRNFRGSFYAADSGLNIARAQLTNQIVSAFPTAAVAYFASPPLASPTTSTSAALSAVTSSYGSFTSLNSGQAANSWSGSFEIANTSSCTNSFTLTPGYPHIISSNAQSQATGYRYLFNYTLCSVGRALVTQQSDTSETGTITVNITAQTSTTQSTQVSFASFGAFINNYPPCLGPLVPGTMTGPMFTNGAWQFMTGGAYIFTDPVSQANAKADYYFGGTCIQSATSSYKNGNQTIAPNFQQGLNLSQSPVPLPPNDFSQQWAVLDGKGQGEGGTTPPNPPPAPTQAQMAAVLKNISGTSYPATGSTPTSGVYIPYSSVSGTNTISGGGIYVAGNASIGLSIGNDSSGNPTQTYTITQGGTSTTITTDVTTNTTKLTSGSTSLTLAGVFENLNASSPQPATMLYVKGTINGLNGPGQGQPAVQDGSQIVIAATGTVNITGDVIYKTEPVTTTANQVVPGTNPSCCSGSPVDTLIPGHDNNQVLGIFTSNGNINLSSAYSNHNLEVDGSLAAIGQSCNTCGFTVSGSINTFNNVGGQIQSNIYAANMNTENTYFDRRFTHRPGFAPPWFPSTTVGSIDITNALPPSITAPPPARISWVAAPQ